MISSYPKVLTVGHRYVEGVITPPNIIEEKVDGSQISFGKDLEEHLCIRSRGAVIHPEAPDSMFREGVDYIKSIEKWLEPGITYRGEYLKKPKHNVKTYDRIPKNHIVIFDVEFYGNPVMTHWEKVNYANAIGLECVPCLAKDVNTIGELEKLLNTESFLGGGKIEGIVIKNYYRITPDGKFMVAKIVNEDFKESHRKTWGEIKQAGKSVIERIVLDLNTEARMNKAVQHLRELGELTCSNADIGKLLQQMHKDIDEEESEHIKEVLYKNYIKDIKRGVCKGLPQWYKDKLMRGEI